MANIITAPESGIYFDGNTAGVSSIPTLTGDASGVAIQYDGYAGIEINSSATGANYLDRFSVEGANGRLFGVTDEVTGTVFSVNDAAGLPIIEVESTSDYDKITIGEYGTDALVVSGDSVGIGTTNPSAKLDVAGTVKATSYFLGSSSEISLATTGAGNVFLRPNGQSTSGQMQLESSGNAIFAGNISIPQPKAFTFANSQTIRDNGGGGLAIRVPIYRLDLIAGTNAGNGHITFQTNNGTERMRVSNGGNVGIGTTSPAEKLHVGGDIRVGNGGSSEYNHINFTRAGGSIVGAIGWHSDNNFYVGGHPSYGPTAGNIVRVYGFGSDIRLGDNTNGDVLTVDATNGNVGIGTTNPDTSLTIKTGSSAGLAKISSDANGAAYSANGDVQFYTNNSAYAINFFSANKAGNLMRITDSGNVGIGTTSPFSKLTVSKAGINEGTISFDDQANNAHLTLAGSDALVRLQMGTYNNGSYGVWIQGSYDNGGTNYGTEPIILNPQGGRVGIGTTGPAYSLHVETGGDTTVLSRTTSNAASAAFTTWNNNGSSGNNMQLKSYGQGVSGTTFGVNVSKTNMLWSSGDTLMAVGTIGATPLIFGTSNAERMRILSSGQLIVGGTAYGYSGTDLQVGNTSDGQNGLNILTSTTGYGYILFGDGLANASSYVGQIAYKHGDDYMMFQTNGSERMRINSSGNVGIGTTSPNDFGFLETALEISAGSSSSTTLQQAGLVLSGSSDADDADDFAYLSFTNHQSTISNGRVAEIRAYKNGSDVDTGELAFFTVLSERMRIDKDGNVGIGTNSPSAKLHVVTNNSAAQLYLQRTGSITGNYRLGVAGATNRFYITDVAQSQDRLVINQSGNVGIGTISPAQKLDVDGNIVAARFIQDTNAGNDFYAAGFTRSSSSLTNPDIYDLNGYGLVLGGTSNEGTLVVKAGGNVGIGTTSPETTLHVNGSIGAYTSDYAAGSTGSRLLMKTFASTGNTYSLIQAQDVGGTSNNVLALQPYGDNVGIGTISPSAKLDVVGASELNGIVYITDSNDVPLRVRSSDGSSMIGISDSNSTNDYSNGIGVYGNALHLTTNGNERIRIDASGNVGIGDTTPSYKLDVNGTLRSTGAAYFNSTVEIGSSLNMTDGDITNGYNIYGNYFVQRAHGIPRNNLGAPTVTEMALFEPQFTCKTDLSNSYNDLSDLEFYVQSTSSSEWTEVTSYSDDQKRRFLRTNNSSVIIPNLSYKYRVEFNAQGYTYANALYMYWSSQSHSTQVHIWKQRASDDTWIQHTSSTNTVSSWPGHLWLPFSTIPWLEDPNSTSTGHYHKIRIEFTPNWSGHATYGDRDIILSGGQIWGGYPTGRRTPHYYDQNGLLTTWGQFKIGDIPSHSSEATALVVNTSNVVGYRELGSNAFNSTSYLPLAGGTMTGVLTLSQNNNLPLRITGSNSNYIAMLIANTGSGNAGVYYDAINGDLAGSDYGFIGQEDAGYMLYNIGASSPAPYHVFTGGNVGIGTTSPDSKLQVKSSGSNIDEITLVHSGNTVKIAALGQESSHGSLHLRNNSGVNKVRLSAGGNSSYILDSNVGIGTASPSVKLQVKSPALGTSANDESTGVIFEGTRHDLIFKEIRTAAATDWNNTTLRLQTRVDTTLMSSIDFVTDGNYNRHIDINTGSNNFHTRFHTNGNVGIGTTSPSSLLHIADSGNDVKLTIDRTDARTYSIYTNSTSDLKIRDEDAGADRITIKSGGNVGIGTTSPSYKLDVAASGGIRAGGKTTYTKNFASGLTTSGEVVAEVTTGYNGASALFEFTCFGGNAGCYQKVIWSLYNASGTWYASNPINEGTNHYDVTYSSGEFTFKTRSGTQAYQPRVIVEAAGDSIDNSYA